MSQILKQKSSLQPKLCNLVGPYKGMQLFAADFNPRSPQETDRPGTCRTISSLSLFDNHHSTISSTQPLNSFSSNASTVSSTSDSTVSRDTSTYPTCDLLPLNPAKLVKPKFETNLCRQLNISIEINEEPVLCGKKLKDEHFEYLIEISLNEHDRWFILRRYSKIRALHEQMCVAYPSLNCLVFPVRQLFNRELINRQLQLEHYLKCFIEVLLNDPTCAIYQQTVEK